MCANCICVTDRNRYSCMLAKKDCVIESFTTKHWSKGRTTLRQASCLHSKKHPNSTHIRQARDYKAMFTCKQGIRISRNYVHAYGCDINGKHHDTAPAAAPLWYPSMLYWALRLRASVSKFPWPEITCWSLCTFQPPSSHCPILQHQAAVLAFLLH